MTHYTPPQSERVLDAVAEAYGDDPAEFEPLLLDLADALGRAAFMATSPTATDYGLECATAAADAAREELLDALPMFGEAA